MGMAKCEAPGYGNASGHGSVEYDGYGNGSAIAQGTERSEGYNYLSAAEGTVYGTGQPVHLLEQGPLTL